MSFVVVDSDRKRMKSFLRYFSVFHPYSEIVMFLECKDAEKYIEKKPIEILFTAEGDEYMRLIQRLHETKPLVFSAVLIEGSLEENRILISQNLAMVSREHFIEVADWVMAKSDELLFSE